MGWGGVGWGVDLYNKVPLSRAEGKVAKGATVTVRIQRSQSFAAPE